MNAPITLTPRNWHDMLDLARSDRRNSCHWVEMIREQAAADGSEKELVNACQLYLDVYGEQDDEADALCEIAECLIGDPNDGWWTQADYDNDDTYAGEWR